MSTDITSAPTNAGVGFLAGLASAIAVQNIEGHPFIFNPLDSSMHDMEKFLPKPLRQKEARSVATLEAFNEYVKRFKGAESSIYVSGSAGRYVITAELDHPGVATGPVWKDHTVSFTLEPSEDLKRWLESNKKGLTQEQFADLLEERARNIIAPPAADILEMANTLHVTRNLSVKSLRRGSSAKNSISFNQEQSLKAGQDGELELPTSFDIGVEPFARYREATKIKALLRPRIVDDHPRFTYELQLVEEAIELILDGILSAIRTQTALPVYR